MRLSDLTKDLKKIAVVYKTAAKEFTVEIEYRTQAVTVGFLSEMQELVGVKRVVYQIEKVISSWDLTDDNDKVIPVTAEAIEKNGIPIYLLSSMLDAIAQDKLVLSDDSKNG